MKSHKELKRLFNEACGLNGMIAEILCKCKMLEANMQNDYEIDVEESLFQMETDFDKYSNRIDQIFVELKSHGFVQRTE